MHDLVLRASLFLSAFLLVGAAAFSPAQMNAACGGGFDDHWLDAYSFRHADNVVLGRLTERDAEGSYHFETLAVYKGQAASPINADNVVDAGVCVATVEPGWRFVYVSGDRQRFGPRDLIFPHVPEYGWLVQLPDGYRSLDGLLALLGVLPDTATAAPKATADSVIKPHLGAVVAALLALTWVFIRPCGGATRAAQRLLRPAADEWAVSSEQRNIHDEQPGQD